jgi:hypothetical protein
VTDEGRAALLRRLNVSLAWRGWPIAFVLTGAIALVLVALLEAMSRDGYLEIEEWRPSLGILIALAAVSLFVRAILGAADDGERVGRTLAGSGLILFGLWVIPSLLGVTVQPTLLHDAFLVAGMVGIAAAVASWTLPGTRTTWLLAFLATLLIWLVIAMSALGLFFDHRSVPRLIHLTATLGWVLLVSWALYVLIRDAERSGADGLLARLKLSDITVTALLGGLLAGYGLWYAYVVGPTDVPPSLDVRVAMEATKILDAGSISGSGEGTMPAQAVRVTFSTRNTSDARVAILGDVYNISGVTQTRALSENPAADVRGYHCRARRVLGRDGSRPCVDPEPEILSGAVGVARDIVPVYTALDVGRIWHPGEWLEPGSESSASVVVFPPPGVDHLRVDVDVLFARAGRLQLAPVEDYRSEQFERTLISRCGGNEWPATRFRRLAGDPLTGLIGAYAPERYEVVWRPAEVPLPMLEGQRLADAQIDLRAVGLDWQCSEEEACLGRQYVSQQDPKAPLMVRPGFSVTVSTADAKPDSTEGDLDARPAIWEMWLCQWRGGAFEPIGADLSIGRSDASESSMALAGASDELVLGDAG